MTWSIDGDRHTVTGRSSPCAWPTAMRRVPSGLQCGTGDSSLPGSRATSSPVAASHTVIDPSSPSVSGPCPTASSVPVGLNSTTKASGGPVSVLSSSPVTGSETMTSLPDSLSAASVARSEPSELTATPHKPSSITDSSLEFWTAPCKAVSVAGVTGSPASSDTSADLSASSMASSGSSSRAASDAPASPYTPPRRASSWASPRCHNASPASTMATDSPPASSPISTRRRRFAVLASESLSSRLASKSSDSSLDGAISVLWAQRSA